MNQEQFDKTMEFFKNYTERSQYQAFRLASYAENIVCMTKCGNDKDAVETVLYGIRNACFDGFC